MEMPPELLNLADTQLGTLTGSQMHAVLRRDQVARLVAAGLLVRLWRDAYALPKRAAELRTRLRAADLTFGGPVAPCLHTAAELWGFDRSGDHRLHLLAPEQRTTLRSTVVLHRQAVHRPLSTIDGRPVLDRVETALTVGCAAADGPHALAALDAAVRSGVPAEELRALAAVIRINRIVRVRRLVDLADGAAESPGESWLRWVILDAGLPGPTTQHWVKIGPSRDARLDLAWPELKIACEYDGVAFHTGEQLFSDRARLNALTRLGWTVVHVTSSMVFAGRSALVRLLSHHLRSAMST